MAGKIDCNQLTLQELLEYMDMTFNKDGTFTDPKGVLSKGVRACDSAFSCTLEVADVLEEDDDILFVLNDLEFIDAEDPTPQKAPNGCAPSNKHNVAMPVFAPIEVEAA